MVYICTTACWHNGKKYRKGDVLKGKPPVDHEGKVRHFVADGPVETDKGQPVDVKPAPRGGKKDE